MPSVLLILTSKLFDSMSTTNCIEIFVLAGGKSSRMGQDKGLMIVNNKPMIKHLLDELNKLEFPVKIIANSKDYNIFGFETISDIIAEKGPMGGLYTALQNTKADYVFLIGCDMPFISHTVINRLTEQVDGSDVTVAIERDKINPLFAVYKCSIINEVEKLIVNNTLKMNGLIMSLNHKLVSIDEYVLLQPNLFLNMNTLNDIINIHQLWNTLE